MNRVPGYTCECPPGFQGDGRVGCEPAEVRTGCQSDFDCTNNAQCGADRTCRCRKGFEPNGALCIDINECTRQPQVCGPSATCTNTQGGYECRCQAPLTGNPPLEPCKGKEQNTSSSGSLDKGKTPSYCKNYCDTTAYIAMFFFKMLLLL